MQNENETMILIKEYKRGEERSVGEMKESRYYGPYILSLSLKLERRYKKIPACEK